MKNSVIYLVFIAIFAVFFSCNSRKKQEQDADQRLKRVEQLINQNALNAAKIEIDSIHSLYPRLVEKRRIAAAFEDTIVRRESARSLAFCDSILPLKQHEADSVLKNFRLEKNAKYQDVGNYIYKTQKVENNTNRNFLRAYVDENANLYLESNYTGTKIEHYAVQVSVADLFAKTDSIPTSNGANHSFTDGGIRWEAVTFKNDAEKGLTAFIAQNATVSIKVTLLGARTVTYLLTEADKKAIAETYHLWIVYSDVAKLQKEITKASVKIERINARKNKR